MKWEEREEEGREGGSEGGREGGGRHRDLDAREEKKEGGKTHQGQGIEEWKNEGEPDNEIYRIIEFLQLLINNKRYSPLYEH